MPAAWSRESWTAAKLMGPGHRVYRAEDPAGAGAGGRRAAGRPRYEVAVAVEQAASSDK